MTRRKLVFIGLVVAALVATFIVIRIQPFTKRPTVPARASPARAATAPLPVYTHEVQSRLLQETITATGTLAADESVELVSEFSGKIVAIAFREDSRVARGEVLLKIDDTELRAQLERAESRLNLARLQAKRQEDLGVGIGTTQDAYDAAVNEARVIEAEAAMVRAQLAKTEIRAPFDGIIGLRYVSEGAYVTPNSRIASLQKTDPIKVEFAVAERHLDRLRRDARVRISVAGLDETFTGQVYAFQPEIDVSTRMIRMRARAPNPANRALPGGFATIELPLREIPEALLVPADALIAGLNAQQLYVLEQGRAQLRTVQTGLRLPREVQIVSGVQAGDIVITSGQMQLRPDMPVEPMQREKAAPGVTAAP